jgi:hypothetical protein
VPSACPSILSRWCAISSVVSDLISSFHRIVASPQKKSRGVPCPTPSFCCSRQLVVVLLQVAYQSGSMDDVSSLQMARLLRYQWIRYCCGSPSAACLRFHDLAEEDTLHCHSHTSPSRQNRLSLRLRSCLVALRTYYGDVLRNSESEGQDTRQCSQSRMMNRTRMGLAVAALGSFEEGWFWVCRVALRLQSRCV